VRQGPWKAIQPSRGGEWELYNLGQDVSESKNVAAEQPQLLDKLKQFAQQAHAPQVIGEIYDRSLVEKDRSYFENQTTGKAKKKKAGAKS
jgi:hypothetical protein